MTDEQLKQRFELNDIQEPKKRYNARRHRRPTSNEDHGQQSSSLSSSSSKKQRLESYSTNTTTTGTARSSRKKNQVHVANPQWINKQREHMAILDTLAVQCEKVCCSAVSSNNCKIHINLAHKKTFP